MKFGTNMHVPLRIRSSNFDDTPNFHLALAAGQDLQNFRYYDDQPQLYYVLIAFVF